MNRSRLTRRLLFPALLVTMVLSVSAVLVELAARAVTAGRCIDRGSIVWVFDKHTGWRHPPNLVDDFWECAGNEYEIRTRVRINSEGFRDRDWKVERTPGLPRILVLGDSMTEALQVEDDQPFSKRLEELLAARGRPAEVFNAGVSGFGNDNQLALLRRLGPKYRPDVVLLVSNLQNDVLENDPWIYVQHYAASGWQVHVKPVVRQRPDGSRYLSTDAMEARARQFGPGEILEVTPGMPRWMYLRHHSEAIRLLISARPGLILPYLYDGSAEDYETRLAGGPAPDPLETYGDPPVPLIWQLHRKPPDAAWRRAWENTRFLVDAIATESRSLGAQPLVAVIPARQTVNLNWWTLLSSMMPVLTEPGWDATAPHLRMIALVEDLGLPLVDLLEPLRTSLADGVDPFFRTDTHLNPAGHRVVAQELVEPVLAALVEAR